MGVPILTFRESFFLESFYTLSASRTNSGFGISPLQLTEILAYCELRNIKTLDQRLELTKIMQALDSEFAKIMAEVPK